MADECTTPDGEKVTLGRNSPPDRLIEVKAGRNPEPQPNKGGEGVTTSPKAPPASPPPPKK